jgi:hypothetical protein
MEQPVVLLQGAPVCQLTAVVSQGVALTREVLLAKLLLHNAYCNMAHQTSWNSSVPLSAATINNLQEWHHSLSTWDGRVAHLHPHNTLLDMDASLSGWGEFKLTGTYLCQLVEEQ